LPLSGPSDHDLHPLVADGALLLSVHEEARAAAAAWIPPLPASRGQVLSPALLRLERGPAEVPPPPGAPLLELRSVRGWLVDAGQAVQLADASGSISGRVELGAGRARVLLAPGVVVDEALRLELSAALTVAAALLLSRLGRALVHAAAVVAPGGDAWLLAAGSFCGKTTTCVNLIRAGWDYLSDDHVVLAAGEGGEVVAEGWRRRFNLDAGFQAGASRGVRSRVDPEGFGPGRWIPGARLGGVLFPRVEAASPTALFPEHPAGALAGVLRHSPWLLADAVAAPAVLWLLQRVARLPARELRLGSDTYADPARLAGLLAEEMNGAVGTLRATGPKNQSKGA
jgi:hypothetical protein